MGFGLSVRPVKCEEALIVLKKKVATCVKSERDFDPRTCGIWAHRTPAARLGADDIHEGYIYIRSNSIPYTVFRHSL